MILMEINFIETVLHFKKQKISRTTKKEGKEAVIGPKAHWRGPGGRP